MSGAVNAPDTVLPFRKNLTVEDVIVLAGGLREAASIINVEVARRLKDPSATRSSNQTHRRQHPASAHALYCGEPAVYGLFGRDDMGVVLCQRPHPAANHHGGKL